MKTTILWDHDGVLVDTEHWYFVATREAIAPLGVDLDHARYLVDMASGTTAWEQARALGVDEAAIVRQREWRDRRYQQFLVEEDIAIPGVEDVLAELGARFRMAIVTTARREDFELIHRNRAIVPHMDFVLANGDYPRAKPAPDPYLTAMQRFGVGADACVVVEDSERGLRSAVAAGIDCAVVEHPFVRGQDFSAARWRIAGLAELVPLLEALR